MPASGFRAVGISEVGHVDGATDVNWGRTQQDGVRVQLTAETIDLQSGQAFMRESVHLVAGRIQLVINLVGSDLTALARIWGFPASALTGDLTAATPTAETLAVTGNNIGSQERTLFALGPGPRSTRRVQAARCRVADLGNVTLASNAYNLPTATWEVLNPISGNALTITDAV